MNGFYRPRFAGWSAPSCRHFRKSAVCLGPPCWPCGLPTSHPLYILTPRSSQPLPAPPPHTHTIVLGFSRTRGLESEFQGALAQKACGASSALARSIQEVSEAPWHSCVPQPKAREPAVPKPVLPTRKREKQTSIEHFLPPPSHWRWD